MKLEVGKFYKLNNGLSVRINDLNAINDNYPIDATVFVDGKVPEKDDKHPPVLWYNELGEAFCYPTYTMYNITQG